MNSNVSIQYLSGKVILKYVPDDYYNEDRGWVQRKFNNSESCAIKNIFTVNHSDLCDAPKDEVIDDGWYFLLGSLNKDDGYVHIISTILSTTHDVLISPNVMKWFNSKFFGVGLKYNLLKCVESIIENQVCIVEKYEASEDQSVISFDDYKVLIKRMPTRTEIQKYNWARINNVVSDYWDNKKNYGLLYDNYLSKRVNSSTFPSIDKNNKKFNELSSVMGYEQSKYDFLLEQLKEMLNRCMSYTETDWRIKISQIVSLLYPRYAVPIEELVIDDYYSKKNKVSMRRIDIALFSLDGNICLVEIKKPKDSLSSILKKGKERDNYLPSHELTGAVMQLEKYIFHLMKMGKFGEEKLYKKNESILKKYGIRELHIANPKGIVICGRSNNLNSQEKLDLEIIKNKYSNIIDIMTYDDLIERLINIKNSFSYLFSIDFGQEKLSS